MLTICDKVQNSMPGTVSVYLSVAVYVMIEVDMTICCCGCGPWVVACNCK